MFCLHDGFQSLLRINDQDCQIAIDASLFALNRKGSEMKTFLVGPEIKDLLFSSQIILMFHGRERIIRLSPTLEPYGQHVLSSF